MIVLTFVIYGTVPIRSASRLAANTGSAALHTCRWFIEDVAELSTPARPTLAGVALRQVSLVCDVGDNISMAKAC